MAENLNYTYNLQSWDCDSPREYQFRRLFVRVRELLQLVDTAPHPVDHDEAMMLVNRACAVSLLHEALGDPENGFERGVLYVSAETLADVEALTRPILDPA